ncbi:chorismate lyase [Neisseria leonii]|uniref:Chorismate lyase n=1 Tax=Neisseria leonii TaxID=2995413 RepID=A0A9X4E125_9NEIS|nr:chorismate lyase [Neisseria sp. 51.81]MDD9327074.1 chorismate lyase [Neisseria sp. 51.81]
MNPTPPAPALAELVRQPSLTRALSALGSFRVQLDFLGETGRFLPFGGFCFHGPRFARNVTLLLDDIPVVHAQSLCSPQSEWREILDCGTTPLGQILFSDGLTLKRSKIRFSRTEHYLLTRQSWFEHRGERLYLSECFLPALSRFLPE